MGMTFFSEKLASKLRVAFPATKSASQYEPTKIHLGYEYIFLENLYSPLFEINPRDGQIIGGLAKSYQWTGDELILEIREDVKTASGKQITADDVEFSLKRLLVLSGNTHGNFKDLVCPHKSITQINEFCDGLKRQGNKVILRVGTGKSFLVSMLAAIDFAIIPKSSVDQKTLAIIDFKETSGPYYVDKDNGEGYITLKVNPNHYRFSNKIPQVIQLVPEDTNQKSSALELFNRNEIDHLTTINKSDAEDVLAYAKENRNILNIHLTHRIQNLALVFTPKGRKQFSTTERYQIGNLVKKAMADALKENPVYQMTEEFFAPLAEGALSPHQREIIDLNNKSNASNFDPKNVHCKIGILRKPAQLSLWRAKIKSLLPFVKIYNEDNTPEFKKYSNEEEIPDALIFNTDTGFSEDIGLISYHLSAGTFGMTKNERQRWLADYMKMESKQKRIEKLKELHFAALNEAILVPIAAAPYISIVRKPWKFELSEMQANNQLWLIKQ